MKRLLLGVCLTLVLSSCGYTTGSNLPANHRTIHIDAFKNNVAYTTDTTRTLYIPLLENRVRTAVIDRFQFDGNLRVRDLEKSDLLLKGSLLSFDREELRITDGQDVQEYRIRITVGITLIDQATGEVVWEEPSFAGEATYFRTGARATSEASAIDAALVDLSRRIVERTIENW